MSYNKTTWNTGDIITADGLNNIQNWIADHDGLFTIEKEVIYQNNNPSWTIVQGEESSVDGYLLQIPNSIISFLTEQQKNKYIQENDNSPEGLFLLIETNNAQATYISSPSFIPIYDDDTGDLLQLKGFEFGAPSAFTQSVDYLPLIRQGASGSQIQNPMTEEEDFTGTYFTCFTEKNQNPVNSIKITKIKFTVSPYFKLLLQTYSRNNNNNDLL